MSSVSSHNSKSHMVETSCGFFLLGLAKIDNRSVTWGQDSALAPFTLSASETPNLRDKISQAGSSFLANCPSSAIGR